MVIKILREGLQHVDYGGGTIQLITTCTQTTVITTVTVYERECGFQGMVLAFFRTILRGYKDVWVIPHIWVMLNSPG